MQKVCLALASMLLVHCGSSDGAGRSQVEVSEPGQELLPGRSGIVLENARGDRVRATAFVPEGTGPFPGVVVLHGSGGLFRTPDDPQAPILEPGVAELENQFETWAELLTGSGFVTLFPDSFVSRGFYDWNEDAPADISDRERLIFRTLDAHAAVHFLCESPSVDCARTALLGFSNGASTVLLSLAEGVSAVEGLGELSAPLPAKRGVAYYPGCGLDGLVSLSEAGAYSPSAPIQIWHAELDPLLEHCPTRVAQAEARSSALELDANPLSLFVYEGEVDHGFDSSPETAEAEAARDDARRKTLALFDAL